MREQMFSGDSIRLGQFLQLTGLADTGADAKAVLQGGDVLVNGEPELRRGRQLVAGDVVDLLGEQVRAVAG